MSKKRNRRGPSVGRRLKAGELKVKALKLLHDNFTREEIPILISAGKATTKAELRDGQVFLSDKEQELLDRWEALGGPELAKGVISGLSEQRKAALLEKHGS